MVNVVITLATKLENMNAEDELITKKKKPQHPAVKSFIRIIEKQF